MSPGGGASGAPAQRLRERSMKLQHHRALSSAIGLTMATVLTITGLATTSPYAQAVDKPAPMAHTIDYVLVSTTSNTSFTSTEKLQEMTKLVSDAWARWSRGMIPEMKMGQVFTLPNYPTSLCSGKDPDLLKSVLGYSPDIYNGQPNGRDLVILASSLGNCGIEGQSEETGTGLSSGGMVTVRYYNVTGTAVTLAHELGHTFGLSHAAGIWGNCNTETWDGPFVSDNTGYPGFCNIDTSVTYGDSANIMGYSGMTTKDDYMNTMDLNGHQKYLLGLIQPGAGLIQTTASADEQLLTIHDTRTSDLDVPQAIRMTADDPDGSGPCVAPLYDIDYDPTLGGVRVFRVPVTKDCGGRTLSANVPDTVSWMAPESPDNRRQYFLPGESQLTSSGKVQIRVVSADPTAGTATVSIRRTDVPGFSSLQVTSDNLATTNTVAATGRTLTGLVTTNQASWSASSDASWVTVTSSGTTGQRLILSAERNTITSMRTATVTVRAGTATKTYSVAQDPGDPSITDDCGVTPASACTLSELDAAVSGAIEIVGDVDWFKFTAPVAGWYKISSSMPADNPVTWVSAELLAADGRSIVSRILYATTFSVGAYLDAGQTAFLQAGSNSNTGNYTVTATYISGGIEVSPPYVEVPTGQNHFTVTVRASGDWTFTGNSYVSASPASGTGNTTVDVTTESNPIRARLTTATFNAAGKTATVKLWIGPGTTSKLAVSPPSLSAAADGDSQVVQIWTEDSWQLITPSWISASETSGRGSAYVTLAMQENGTGQERTGYAEVTGSGETVSVPVTQAAKPGPVETLYVDQPTINAAAGGDTQTVRITASGDWRIAAASGSDWVSVSPASGTGNDSVSVTTTANTSGQPRTGSITVTSGTKTATVTVNQLAATIVSFSLSAAEIGFSGDGGTQELRVSSNVAWRAYLFGYTPVTLSQMSGTGDATLTVTMPPNDTGYTRNDVLAFMAGGQAVAIIISQPARPKHPDNTLTLDTTAFDIDAGGGSRSVGVASSTRWHANGPDWITVDPEALSGSGSMKVAAAANLTGMRRMGIVSVTNGDQTVTLTVNQEGAPLATYLDSPIVAITPPAAGITVIVEFSTDGPWLIQSDQWVTPASSSGLGTSQLGGRVNVTFAPNTTGSTRTGWFTITTGNRTIRIPVSQYA